MVQLQRREFLIRGGRAALGCSLLSIAGCATHIRKSTGPRDAVLDSLVAEWEKGIPQWLQDTKMPGVSIAVIRDGGLAWRRGFGVKDTGTNEPIDTDTVFAACSNTKPVFAYAVAKLCERGVMDLDTPLTKYTSERIIADPRLDLITARHVLNHTTGFPNWRQDPEPLALQFTPGEKFQYSGEGFSYLQLVVDRVTGQSFETFMRNNILVPFGMTSSRVSVDMTYARRLAKPHDSAGKRIPGKYYALPTEAERVQNLARYGAAACLMTTPTDYARFLLEILNPKPADRFRLSDAGIRELLRPQAKKDDTQSEALGWAIAEIPGVPTMFLHAGQDAGYYCTCNASAKTRSGLMIMMNGDNYDAFLAKLAPDPLAFLKTFFA